MIFEKSLEKEIPLSRQHFIRLQLPHTYRILESLSITDDFSMGYASELGFRAGTGRSFLWYDLEKEVCSELRVHPFCFMDATAHYYKKWTAEEETILLEELNKNMEIVLIATNHKRTPGSIHGKRKEIAYKMHTSGIDMQEIIQKTKLNKEQITETIIKKELNGAHRHL